MELYRSYEERKNDHRTVPWSTLYDGNAVTAENIIRGEIGESLRPMNNYAQNDWAVRDMTTSISKAYYRQMFHKRTF